MNETIKKDEWEDVEAVATVTASMPEDEWEDVTDETQVQVPDVSGIEPDSNGVINLGTIVTEGNRFQNIEDTFKLKADRLNKAKEVHPEMSDVYDEALLKLDKQKIEEIDKAREAELKSKEREGKINNFNSGQFGKGVETGLRTLSDSALGILKISEDVSNLVKTAVGGDPTTPINDYIQNNKEQIAKLEKEMGYNEGDLLTPANLSRVANSIVETTLPFLKATKLLPTNVGTISGVAGTQSGVQSLGSGDNYEDSANNALTTTALTYAGGKAIDYAVSLMKGKESLVFNRLKDNLSMTQEAEEAYYRRYATMFGKKAEQLTDADKVSALVYANPDARVILYGAFETDPLMHSQFNNFAKGISDDLISKFNSGDELTVQKAVGEVESAYKETWKDFKGILETQYSDTLVNVPANSELRKMLYDVAKYTKDNNTMQMLNKNTIPLPDLLKMKQLIGSVVYKQNTQGMDAIEGLKFTNNKKIYDDISNLFDVSIPKELKGSYDSVRDITKLRAGANAEQLLSRFDTVKGVNNLEAKDLTDVMNSMRAKSSESSYNQMMKLIGTDSTSANTMENLLLKNITQNHTKEGFTDFVRTVDNLEDINFKTPEGKALKTVFEEYKKVFNNVSNTTLSRIQAESTGAGLTINPIVSTAYSVHRHFYNQLAEFVGITKNQRNMYLLKTLPKVLETKSMPKSYSIKEQRGALAISELHDELKRMNVSPEELESGGIYPTSQMIGETGAKQLPNDIQPVEEAITKFMTTDAKETWKETKWFYDDVDSSWKFHLSGDDVKIKMGKGRISQNGTYNLEDVIEMPKLFEAYPELKTRRIKFEFNKDARLGGSHTQRSGRIMINNNPITLGNTPIKSVKETLVHEIQHSIQGIEGFAAGGSAKNNSREAFRNYESLHGEVEARALTKGNVGVYPKDLYDMEYTNKNLNRGVTNYRANPVGSNKPMEVIK